MPVITCIEDLMHIYPALHFLENIFGTRRR